jgi:(p)ppGpp synthase/HD superfamily hydrolase
MYSEHFQDALIFAAKLHQAQVRKGTSIPYISHLLSVCALVIENGGKEDQAIAALLHDAAEDQGGESVLVEIQKRYGDAVANIVADCTDAWTEPKPPWRQRKEAYLASLPAKPPVSLLVSLADKVHNVSAILNDHQALGDQLWTRFNGGHEGTIWYYQSLSDVFNAKLPSPLTRRFSDLVTQLSATRM